MNKDQQRALYNTPDVIWQPLICCLHSGQNAGQPRFVNLAIHRGVREPYRRLRHFRLANEIGPLASVNEETTTLTKSCLFTQTELLLRKWTLEQIPGRGRHGVDSRRQASFGHFETLTWRGVWLPVATLTCRTWPGRPASAKFLTMSSAALAPVTRTPSLKSFWTSLASSAARDHSNQEISLNTPLSLKNLVSFPATSGARDQCHQGSTIYTSLAIKVHESFLLLELDPFFSMNPSRFYLSGFPYSKFPRSTFISWGYEVVFR